MREKMRGRGPAAMVVVLFLLACWLSVAGSRKPLENLQPRAAFNDATPLGGKGLRLVLERLGFKVQRQTDRISAMPADARAWLLLDPETGFSKAENALLLDWVKRGNTLIWAVPPSQYGEQDNNGVSQLRANLNVLSSGGANITTPGDLPTLTLLTFTGASVLRSDVATAAASGSTVKIDRTHTELASNPTGVELAEIPLGKGHIIIAPDALIFTNYALMRNDNAALVTNFVRAYAPSGGVYFDERSHGELGTATSAPFKPNLLYYISHGAARWAMLQLIFAGLLLWVFFGRRLGTPVPLPTSEPVTRAGNYALAMGLLFRKANRPQAAAEILGEEFRRALARRLGLSPSDPDAILAAAAERASDLPARFVDRLLLKSKNPAQSDAEALADAQDMEQVLRRLDHRP